MYEAYDRYLSILTGEDVEGGLAYFRAEADKSAADVHGSYSAVERGNLLLALTTPAEGLVVGPKQ